MGDSNSSVWGGLLMGNDWPGTLPTADGFDSKQPCPPTELFNSGMDVRLIANQEMAHNRSGKTPGLSHLGKP
jgi:hypothetical protein